MSLETQVDLQDIFVEWLSGKEIRLLNFNLFIYDLIFLRHKKALYISKFKIVRVLTFKTSKNTVVERKGVFWLQSFPEAYRNDYFNYPRRLQIIATSVNYSEEQDIINRLDELKISSNFTVRSLWASKWGMNPGILATLLGGKRLFS